MDPQELTTVFRSPRRRDCEERLLVLTAVGGCGFVRHEDGNSCAGPRRLSGLMRSGTCCNTNGEPGAATAATAAARVPARVGRQVL